MISVILPIYNAEKTLNRTLDSIFSQTFQDFEIIAINDQSTDSSLEILKSYQNQKIRILNTKDINQKGIVAALNYGIKESTRKLIARIDSDDLMAPTRLSAQFAEFQKNPELLLCSSDASLIDENNNILGGSLISTDNLEELDYKCCIIHPSVMFKKEFFVNNNLFYNSDFEYAEDYELWLRLRNIVTGNYYKHIKEPLIAYRISGENRISNIHSDIQKERTRLARKTHNIKPFLSIINFGNKALLEKELLSKNFGYEIISDKETPQGKFIAYSKYENRPERFEAQIQLLLQNKKLVGCGTYIDTGKNSFFYTPDSNIIESELLKGKIAIEQSTFLFRNTLQKYPHNDYFSLLCDLLPFGMYTNLQQPFVKIPDYTGIQNFDFTKRIKQARKAYKDIINIVQINITSDGNFSGVDRYLKTLEDNYPSNIRCKRITFIASANKLSFDTSNPDHAIIYYNTSKTQLENLYDLVWDNLKHFFVNKRNLIVQSNCFNLFSLLTYLRRKVSFKHICMVHCVPYREVIRNNRDEFAKLEALFNDESKEFNEIAWHYDAVNLADHVILNTKDSEKYYNRVGYATPYTIIYNGIEKIGKMNKPTKDPFRFIFVGHSSPLKGFDRLLKVIEDLSKTRKFEIVWAGNADPSILEYILQKKLPITHLGVVPPEELNRIYQQVDCALIATACETCSYAAIEALSAGLPIISTRAHGVEEIIENVGLLVNTNIRAEFDLDMYKDAMIRVMNDAQLRKDMSERSLERFKLYSKENLLNSTIELYKKLLN